MKKNIILLLTLTVVPYLFCMIFSMFRNDIRIGQGDNSLEHHLLGKDILIDVSGLYKSMDVEKYVLGVLPGTISADYDEEALKIQAILIRTNVLKEMQEKGTNDASDLSYQYLTAEDRMNLFGNLNYEKYEKKFEQAVVSTAGQVLRQEDSLIMALYHEVSIGKTASAKEILDEDISYLQSVDSNQDVEAKHYMNVVPYTWEEFHKLEQQAAEKEEGAKLQESQDTEKKMEESTEELVEEVKAVKISVTESTENGFVKQLSVDGTIYTGEQAMERYDLPSTNFYVEEIKDGIRFVCLGKGNCLGLSQYGANVMALSGEKAEDIIKYYYKGVSLEQYE